MFMGAIAKGRGPYPRSAPLAFRRGFSLVEVLAATALTLVLLGMAVQLFAMVGSSIRESRGSIQTSNELRSVQRRLQADLAGITVTPLPPRRSEQGDGYLEIHEGPIGPCFPRGLATSALSTGATPTRPDNTVQDIDDTISFTIRSKHEPFVGRFPQKRSLNAGETRDGNDALGDFKWNIATISSDLAEVVWFLRGTTLYRRQLLIASGQLPDFDLRNNTYDSIQAVRGWYAISDLSVRQVGGSLDRGGSTAVTFVPNTLADLARREHRFGHQPYAFPHEAQFWQELVMPTLRETANGERDTSPAAWPFPLVDPMPAGAARVQSPIYTTDPLAQLIVPSLDGTNPLALANGRILLTPTGRPRDLWVQPFEFTELDRDTGSLSFYNNGTRLNEDVIAAHVIGFDARVFDPGAPVIVHNATGQLFEPSDGGYIDAVNGLGGAYSALSYGAYVDLNYMKRLGGPAGGDPAYTPAAGAPRPRFHHAGNFWSRLRGAEPNTGLTAGDGGTFDSWTDYYERDGYDQNLSGQVDEGTDGVDNNGTDGVDDPTELEAPPPYSAPLRGMQIRITIYEPESKLIREVTVSQDFLLEE